MPEAALKSPTDEELARDLSAGDLAAFDQLVERHQRRIRTLAFRLSGALSEVDDLTQETFLRVYRHRDAFQPERPFATWVTRICVNVCLTHRHRARRHVALERVPEPAAPAGDPAGALSVKQVLDALAEPFRTTLILRVFGGLSYEEIAAEMTCSLGTVMSRLSRARAQVREQLEEKP